MNKALKDQIMSLPPDEKYDLVMDLWDSIPESELPPVPEAQLAEAERRFEAYLKDPTRDALAGGDGADSGSLQVKWRLIVEAAAEAEILAAAEWYVRRNPEARERFLAAVDGALAVIENNPLQYQVVRGVVRRALVKRFPYGLLYSISEDQVVVGTVCFHTSRDPRHWQARFPL